eukprot:2485111-Rhodomonas_salina.1
MQLESSLSRRYSAFTSACGTNALSVSTLSPSRTLSSTASTLAPHSFQYHASRQYKPDLPQGEQHVCRTTLVAKTCGAVRVVRLQPLLVHNNSSNSTVPDYTRNSNSTVPDYTSGWSPGAVQAVRRWPSGGSGWPPVGGSAPNGRAGSGPTSRRIPSSVQTGGVAAYPSQYAREKSTRSGIPSSVVHRVSTTQAIAAFATAVRGRSGRRCVGA